MSYFNCFPTIYDSMTGVWYLSHKRTSKDQTRLHIGAVSPEPLQITVKRRDVDEGSGQIL